MTKFKQLWTAVRISTVALALSLAAGCGGGGGEGGAESTGTVSVLMTDAPSPDFSAINVTVTRIDLMNDAGLFTLYSGNTTFDLLRLENFSSLFSLTSGVPHGEYDAIRLTLSSIELVENGSGDSFYPPLGGNGKLDLVPSQPFTVAADSVLVLEIDMDAKKSVHVTSGGGGYRFRPVVFVNVGVEQVSHLVQIHGVVSNIDLVSGSFEICRVDDRNGSMTVTDECMTARLTDEASIFNPDGAQGVLGDMLSQELVTVIGKLDPNDPSVILVDVVERDALAAYVTLYGTAQSAPNGDAVFRVTLDVGQEATDDPAVDVQLQPGTRVFDASGAELDASAIAADLLVEASGVLSVSETGPDTLWVEWVIVSEPAAALESLTGFVLYRELDYVMLFTDSGNRCAWILADADIQVVTESSQGTTIDGGGLPDLTPGREVVLHGTEGSSGCFDAESAVVYVIAD